MTLTIYEFVSLLNSIQEYSRLVTQEYPQYPQRLSDAYQGLTVTLETSFYTESIQKAAFEKFMLEFVRSVESNYGFLRNDQTNNAECLLGFLLFHNISVIIADHTYCVNDVVRHFVIEKDHLYGYSHQPVSYFYCFSMPNWRAQQNYPTIDTLRQCWLQLHQQSSIASQPQAPSAQEDYDSKHYTLEELSYFIEGFLMGSHIKPNMAYSTQNNGRIIPCLPDQVSQLLQSFTQQARACHPDAYSSFLILIKILVTHGCQRDDASQLFIGFLLFHQFHLQQGEQSINLTTLLTNEFMSQGLVDLHSNRAKVSHRFLDKIWISCQEYPSKADLVMQVRFAYLMSQSKPQENPNSVIQTNAAVPPMQIRRERTYSIHGQNADLVTNEYAKRQTNLR